MKYFAYGMNTNLDQMAGRCPGATSLGPAQLDNYEFVFRTHADIAKTPGSVCYGVLWDIDPEHLRALDALEGYPHYYTRFRVRINLGDQSVYALTYQMNDQSYLQEPSVGYLQMVTEGYQQNGVPTDQIDRAINMVCSSLTATNVGYPYTQSATTKDFV
jgi:gamma-glutamylcyclotransferase (GGCT)/AIG2-like uncharacterized protein YtfP